MKLTPLSPLAAAAAALLMTACGGGGGGSSEPPSPTPLTVTGTAATGAAIDGGAVTVTCAEGEGGATTMPSGSYSVTIADATPPCLVRVVSSDLMTTLYSMVAAGSPSPSAVNVTPLTTLMTAQVLGADPATITPSAGTLAPLTSTNITTAQNGLTAALDGTIDIAGIDPISTPFAVGDATDQLLDDLAAALDEAQLTPAELAAALIANPGQPEALQTALAPAASTCPSLRSLPVVLVSLGDFVTATVDSETLTTTYDGGALPTETLTDLGNCEFLSSSGTEVVVSPSSIGINRFPTGGGNFSMAFGFPRQQLPLSELAGNWSYVTYISYNGGPLTPGHGSFTLDSAGRNTGNFEFCTGFNDCETEPALPTDVLTAVPEVDGGGFVEGSTMNRAFAFRAPNGTTTLFYVVNSQDGVSEVGYAVATKQTSLELPAVGLVTPFSQFSINSSGVAGAIDRDVSTVTAVDAGADSFTRTLLNGAAQTFLFNSPRDSMAYRAAGSSPNSMGTPVSFPAAVQLRPPGTGIVLVISAAEGQNFFNANAFTPAPAAP